jgi:hypothetical protein
MDLLLCLLAMYAAIAGIMALAVVWVLGRFGKKPSFARVFIWCVLALYLLSIVANCIATYPWQGPR